MTSPDFRSFLSICLLVASASGCARGCQGEPPAVAPVRAPEPPKTPAASLEGQLHVVLAQRKSSDLLPGMATLPYRRLPEFAAAHQLLLVADRAGLHMLEHSVPTEKMSDDAAVTELLRWGMSQWATRSGLAANRLVVVLDASLQTADVARLRRLAMTANTWRVVALARDGDTLVELLLDPPAGRAARP